MLEVSNLRKEFGDVTAVDDLSFTIEPGEIMGLIGQNGSGKTTTFRLILNLLNQDKGTVFWNNEPVTSKQFNQIGYLPEERGLYPKVTIEDQLLYFAELRGRKRKDIQPKIDEWMDRFDVKGKKKDKVKSLSKGNQQKVQLITTMIHEPSLIILDEPFSGLDPVNADLLENGIKQARDNGASIIFSSHNMNNVEELCDSLVMLKKGKQVLSGTVKDIRETFGRTRLFLESRMTKEDLDKFKGVKDIRKQDENRLVIELKNPEVGEQIFSEATKDGYIPTFSQQPPSLEEIFKRTAGEKSE